MIHIYPWQQDAWRILWASPDRLPHALLLQGPSGVGKRGFARALAQRLLCERASGAEPACGQCDSCRWYALDNHPDLHVLVPQSDADMEEDAAAGSGKLKRRRSQILIDQVRALQGPLALAAHRSGRRIVLIDPAEAMNRAAANALLKSLEEPHASNCFLLITDDSARLLATLRSRCASVRLGAPDSASAQAWLAEQGVAEAAKWLALAGGRPLAAARLAEPGLAERRRSFVTGLAAGVASDALQLAAEWEAWLGTRRAESEELTPAALVDWMQCWLVDLALFRSGAAPRYHPGAVRSFARLAGAGGLVEILRCYNELNRMRRYAEHPLNVRLFLEELALCYQDALR